MEAPGYRFVSSKLTRRRFLQLAILSSSTVVLPIPRVWAADDEDYYCTPGAYGWQSSASDGDRRAANNVIPYPPNGAWNRSTLQVKNHYGDSPRKGYIVVHHAGYPNAHQNTDPCTACNVPGDHVYDFCIDYAGDICDTGRWDDTTGAHALGCNCNTVGIMLQGCFGGCSYGNVSGPSYAQKCSLAYLSLHLTTSATLNRHRPHRRCYYWNPCAGDPGTTVCCGTNLTTGSGSDTDKWNSTGEDFIYEMLAMRACLAQDCSCDCLYC